MVEVSNHKLNDILNHHDANYLRVLLCEVYLTKEPTGALVNQAIMAVNEFLFKMENEKMLQELKRTDEQFNVNEHLLGRRRRRSKKA